jgi:hypothetical protein
MALMTNPLLAWPFLLAAFFACGHLGNLSARRKVGFSSFSDAPSSRPERPRGHALPLGPDA